MALLLCFCQLLCRALWKLCWNPDNNAIPLLTALGDLLGTSLLAMAFFTHTRLFPEYAAMDYEGMMTGNGTTPAIIQALLRMSATEEGWEWHSTAPTAIR